MEECELEEIKLKTWDEFQSQIKELYNLGNRDKHPTAYSDLLFRGQSDAEWSLKTTLERWAGDNISLNTYYHKIFTVHPEIESRTGRRWQIPSKREYSDFSKKELFPRPYELYEYLVYLRHHGFPSPLLDWTTSPYVAAYFAFRSAPESENVALFAYREYAGKGKSRQGKRYQICALGPYVRSHERHFLQQCQYTICIEEHGDTINYIPHEKVFSDTSEYQDLLWKFVLPIGLRKNVLNYLHLHNITSSSLFNSEDMLMESLALREFILREHDKSVFA
jgi:hypothetical protein